MAKAVAVAANEIAFDLATVPDKDRERVAALIPDPRIAEGYVHRSINGIYDFDLLDGAVEEQENVLLAGPTGSSKTTLFRSYASARGLPFVDMECNGAMDPGVIIGRITLGPDGAVEWVDGDWTLVVRYGGVGLIDEINMAHPRIVAAYHLLLSVVRRMSLPEAGEVIAAGRGGLGNPQPTLFGAAYNPRYDGTVRLNAALKNRFAQKHPWRYERSVEDQLVKSSTLLDLAYSVRSLAEIRSPLSTNMLQEYERHVYKYNMQAAKGMLIAAFEDEEQAPISRAIEAEEANIASDLGVDFALA